MCAKLPLLSSLLFPLLPLCLLPPTLSFLTSPPPSPLPSTPSLLPFSTLLPSLSPLHSPSPLSLHSPPSFPPYSPPHLRSTLLPLSPLLPSLSPLFSPLWPTFSSPTRTERLTMTPNALIIMGVVELGTCLMKQPSTVPYTAPATMSEQ